MITSRSSQLPYSSSQKCLYELELRILGLKISVASSQTSYAILLLPSALKLCYSKLDDLCLIIPLAPTTDITLKSHIIGTIETSVAAR
jgi:hypothetical protein